MKKIYILAFVLLFLSLNAKSQTAAITADGKRVVFYQNGSWRYNDSINSYPAQDVSSLYGEAYDYAYQVLYGDELFSGERKNKSVKWAEQYVRDNLSVAVGYKTLDSWFDELYAFAWDHVVKDVFSTERRAKAIEWTAQIMKEKAYYEDFRSSLITRHRQAYDLAYNKIYRYQFSSSDKRTKAFEWAKEFVKR